MQRIKRKLPTILWSLGLIIIIGLLIITYYPIFIQKVNLAKYINQMETATKDQMENEPGYYTNYDRESLSFVEGEILVELYNSDRPEGTWLVRSFEVIRIVDSTRFVGKYRDSPDKSEKTFALIGVVPVEGSNGEGNRDLLSLKARERFEKLLMKGKWKSLEYDEQVQSENGDHLVYLWVYVETPGNAFVRSQHVMINDELIREGLAVHKPMPPNLRWDHRLSKAQILAQEERLGIWSE